MVWVGDDLPPMVDAKTLASRYPDRSLRWIDANVIRAAGGRKIGRSWMVREDVLDAWETEQASSQIADSDQRSRSGTARRKLPPLPPDWYVPQDGGDAA